VPGPLDGLIEHEVVNDEKLDDLADADHGQHGAEDEEEVWVSLESKQ